jgi:16S rRNA (cytosine1402-N4)-methyltransferase
MSEPAAPDPHPERAQHVRRPRYRGKNPRRFEDKYKELDPERFPELIAHVRARGATPAGQHVPILVEEVLKALAPKPGERGVDATLGFGGHAQRLLDCIAPQGQLLALDCDPIESARTQTRLWERGFAEPALLVGRTNFASLSSSVAELGWSAGVNFVFADLGLSSMQIDDPKRGFTFKHDGPLDMRMNPRRGRSAAEWLAQTAPEELARALHENADEPHAQRIAQAAHPQRGKLTRTVELAQLVRDALAGVHSNEQIEASVRRVFQAVRIEVNDEFGALDGLLRQLPEVLQAQGRVAILSFHSGEDRRVKKAFLRGIETGSYASASQDVVRPSAEERHSNPRAGPAKLRWATRA